MGFDCRCGGGNLQRSRTNTKDTPQKANLRARIHGPDLKIGNCVRGEIRVRSVSPPPGLAPVPGILLTFVDDTTDGVVWRTWSRIEQNL